jgi:hypothetical protein
MSIEKDMQHIMKNHPAIAMLEHSKIQLFYQQATSHLQIITKQVDTIKEKYVEKSSDGKYIVVNNADGTRSWKFLQTYVDIANAITITGKEVEKRFNQDINDYLNSKSLTIIY